MTQVNRRFAGRAGFLGALQGGFEQISLNDGEAGAVFLVEVLKHLELDDMGRVLAELERVLRPGGHLIITVPNKENLDARIEPVSVATLDFHDFVGNALSRAVKSLANGKGFPTMPHSPSLCHWQTKNSLTCSLE